MQIIIASSRQAERPFLCGKGIREEGSEKRMVDIEKSEKFPPEQRYVNISMLWIFYFRQVVRILHHLRFRHEAVTLMSIALGMISAYFFYRGNLLAAAVAIHFKDVFDACDGALARLTGKGHLIGRYLDSLGDFVVLSLVVTAITVRAVATGEPSYLAWGPIASLSLFIQCSFFNYYHLRYAEHAGGGRLTSKTDESSRADLDSVRGDGWKRRLLYVLRFWYIVVFGWQDKLAAVMDGWLCRRSGKIRYDSKPMMTLYSALCFGTHIFVMIVCALAGRPQYALIFIATVMNLYLVVLLAWRIPRRGRRGEPTLPPVAPD